MSKTEEQWLALCDKITGGFTPKGDKAKTFSTGKSLVQFFINNGIVHPGDVILDVGCANGRVAMGLSILGIPCIYEGVEIVKPAVDFCKRAFADEPGFHFTHLDLYSTRYWHGSISQDKVVYPFEDNTFDVVIANSLFSHTGTLSAATRTLQEMRRVLKDNGQIFTTWIFDIEEDEDHARTVYDRAKVEKVLQLLGFTFSTLEWSFSQTILLLRKND